ncbi:MAG: hypothetical protein OWU32_08815 [Firmicutes bacterium]|nr:hypothetical protein [Bacillota bacterium]
MVMILLSGFGLTGCGTSSFQTVASSAGTGLQADTVGMSSSQSGTARAMTPALHPPKTTDIRTGPKTQTVTLPPLTNARTSTTLPSPGITTHGMHTVQIGDHWYYFDVPSDASITYVTSPTDVIWFERRPANTHPSEATVPLRVYKSVLKGTGLETAPERLTAGVLAVLPEPLGRPVGLSGLSSGVLLTTIKSTASSSNPPLSQTRVYDLTIAPDGTVTPLVTASQNLASPLAVNVRQEGHVLLYWTSQVDPLGFIRIVQSGFYDEVTLVHAALPMTAPPVWIQPPAADLVALVDGGHLLTVTARDRVANVPAPLSPVLARLVRNTVLATWPSLFMPDATWTPVGTSGSETGVKLALIGASGYSLRFPAGPNQEADMTVSVFQHLQKQPHGTANRTAQVPTLFGDWRITHTFALSSVEGPSVEWQSARSRAGLTRYFASFDVFHWHIEAGPFLSPASVPDQATLSGLLSTFKEQPPMQNAEGGSLFVLISPSSAAITASEINLRANRTLSVSASGPGLQPALTLSTWTTASP